jgi:uncharacterized protein (TIGR03435 family)
MTKSSFAIVGASLLIAARLTAQTPASKPTFEVATIKPAEPIDAAKIMSGKMHLGMTIDKARVDIGGLPLSQLIAQAYKIKPYQLSGPDWMNSTRFDVIANIPEGVSKDQVPEMLQALLAERFKLAIHRDTTEHNVYALVVAKGGHKMKEAVPDPETTTTAADGDTPSEPAGRGGMVIGRGQDAVRVNPNNDGKGSTITGGRFGQMKMSMGEGGTMRMEFAKMSMTNLVDMLAPFTDRPVLDMTELKGNYQVVLDLTMDEMKNIAAKSGMGMMMGPGSPPAGDSGRAAGEAASTPGASSIFQSMQQLGLKLEPRKAPIEKIVVDHIEKTPTDN